jgi:hypothetical protein
MADQKIELMPLETLHADAAYLVGRVVNGTMEADEVVAVIRSRIDAARDALAAQGGQEAEPVLYVSPGQLAKHQDREDDSGGYLPARKTPKGMFTQPLYAAHPPRTQGDDPKPIGFTHDAGQVHWFDGAPVDATDIYSPPRRNHEDTEMLDFMESHRVLVTPEYEGLWEALVYGDDEKPSIKGVGKTPRGALAAAIARQGGKD